MKLCWIHPTTANDTLEPLWESLDTIVRPVLNPGTELEFRFLEKSGNFTRSLYAEHINSVHMVEAALQAEADGFDAVFFGCWNDALWEAREVLGIPIGSVSEQSMLAALTMGKRFAVVTVSQKTTVAIENDLLAYGLRDRAIVRPVRTIMPESDGALLLSAVKDPYETFIPRFEEVAAECIRDGAEVILVGCAYYGPLMRAAGYREVTGTGVTVLDASSVALKYVETMADIARTMGYVKSDRLHLKAPPRDALDRSRRTLGLI
ncbi:hydantoin racemase [Rhizobium sp. ACO-34A]|nr:aspartate/glutamate racemase family protein [Rhizobium sp. ACO-34A]ATN35985.1 hydantoin racemase [Rhizobium sp. ACO-34A]